MTRIVGHKGSRRRRWLAPCCAFIAVGASILFNNGAQSSVHDVSVFQLEGDAFQTTDSNGFGGDDWSNICTTSTNNPATNGCVGDGPQASHLIARGIDYDEDG